MIMVITIVIITAPIRITVTIFVTAIFHTTAIIIIPINGIWNVNENSCYDSHTDY